MIDPESLLLFVVAAIFLLVTPGPAVLYIVARSIEQGRVAGFVSTLGIGLGGILHVVFAALGLSALLVKSALAFAVLKYLGAAYLIYLGVKKLLSKPSVSLAKGFAKTSHKQLFLQGFIVNALNPKTALFFLAFLPQFIDPGRGDVTLQILLLGAVFIVMAVLSDGIYALVAGAIGEKLSGSRSVAVFEKYFSGMVFILLGLGAAFAGHDGVKSKGP